MTKRLYHIVNLDTGAGYYFQAITPMDAMTQLRYTYRAESEEHR